MQLPPLLQDKLWPWWQGRSPRERAMLAAWMVVVAVLALGLGVVVPLVQRIAFLEKRLPQLEQAVSQMRIPLSAGQEAPAPVPQSDGDLRSVVYSQLAELKLNGELRALSPTRVEIRLPAMPMQNGLDLLNTLRQRTGARIAVLGVKSGGDQGPQLVAELERAP